MKIKLLDYQSNPSEHEIGDLEDIASIHIEVISGDEVMSVHYKNGKTEIFDSCSSFRCMAFHDCSYTIYEPAAGINHLEDENWLKRSDSYDF